MERAYSSSILVAPEELLELQGGGALVGCGVGGGALVGGGVGGGDGGGEFHHMSQNDDVVRECS